MNFTKHFSSRVENLKPAAIRQIMAKARGKDFISMAPGKPSPTLFPYDRVAEKSALVTQKYGGDSMQYSATQGFPALREWIAGRMPHAEADDLCIVSGSQQAIDLVGKVFIDKGDKVVVSNPTYTGALSTLNVYGTEYIGVDCDEDGMLPDALEAALQQGPKFIYAVPNFMNPTGVDMSLERRQQLVALARQYEVPIFEDDPYGEMRFEGEPLPSLYELDPEIVIYASTFSKTLAPGFRIAWIAAPKQLLDPLIVAKQTGDLQTSIFIQMLIYEVAQEGFMDAQIGRMREYYHTQRDSMIRSINEHFPPEVKYVVPKGGMFVWCELPDGHDTVDYLVKAIEEKVVFVPGAAFYHDGSRKNTLRLSFSLSTEAEMDEGLKKIGAIFHEAMG